MANGDQHLVPVPTKMPVELRERLRVYAEELGISVSAAARKLIEAGLDGEAGDQVAKDLKSGGYQEGLRLAARRFREEFGAMVTRLFEEYK